MTCLEFFSLSFRCLEVGCVSTVSLSKLLRKFFAQGETLCESSARIRASYNDLILFKNKHQAPVAVRNNLSMQKLFGLLKNERAIRNKVVSCE